ncbi:Protein Shroom4, partial [Manis pentadactyla]
FIQDLALEEQTKLNTLTPRSYCGGYYGGPGYGYGYGLGNWDMAVAMAVAMAYGYGPFMEATDMAAIVHGIYGRYSVWMLLKSCPGSPTPRASKAGSCLEQQPNSHTPDTMSYCGGYHGGLGYGYG